MAGNGEDPVTGFIRDMIFRRRVNVVGIARVARQSRNRADELRTLAKNKKSGSFTRQTSFQELTQQHPAAFAGTGRFIRSLPADSETLHIRCN